MKSILIVTTCACLAGCAASPARVEINSTVIARTDGPATTDKLRTLYEDDEMRIAAVDYGHHTSPQTPGFYVLGKSDHKWIRIEKVTLKDAILGRSPTFEECRAAGVNPPSIGWDFRSLAGHDYAELPLRSSGFLFFPDKIEKNGEEGRLVLRFNSGWRMARVETVLVMALDDLQRLLGTR